MKQPFHTLLTHSGPHLSDIVAIWLLKKFGDEKFPGVSTAKVEYWSGGSQSPNLRSSEKCEQDGILLIGIGGGRFDEHPTVNGKRKEGECEATLVAKELGLEDDPVLKQVLHPILKFALANDTKGAAHPFDLASLTQLLHRQYPNEPERVMEWVLMGLEAKYQAQMQFFTAAQEEFEQAAEIEEVPGPNGHKLTVVTIASDNESAHSFARSDFGGRATIVILKKSSGNVQIFTNKKHRMRYRLTLVDVAKMIRLAEQRAKGKVLTADWNVLASGEVVEGAEEWYFHEKMQALLNGSLSHPETPPTKLSLEKIREIVRIGINPKAFESERSPDCLRGMCTSKPGNPCSWYNWGLRRCRSIRFEMKRPRVQKAERKKPGRN